MANMDEAIEALLDYQQADMDGVMVLTSRQAIHEVADEIKRLRATQPAAPAAKPVAWQYQLKNGQWANLPTDWQESENMPDRTYRPLYSAPSAMAQSDEPRYYLSARRIRDTEEVGTGECSSAGIATPQEFPYQQTFDAIAAATELWPCKEAASGISISVRKFQEAFNSHRDAKPPVGVAQPSPQMTFDAGWVACREKCALIAEGTAPVASGNFFVARRDQCVKIAAKIRGLSIPSTQSEAGK